MSATLGESANAAAWPAVPLMPSLPGGWALARMSARDLDAVVDIEQRAYSHPWTRGNFENSVKAGHVGLTLRDPAGTLVGYAVLMPVVDEMHLLNITIEPARHRQGIGKLLLAVALATAHQHRLPNVLLEVRPSNAAALALYHVAGFQVIGRRKGYYPAADGAREDALVLRRRWDAGQREPGEPGMAREESA